MKQKDNRKRKFKGYDIVDAYPSDGWLGGYFYVNEEDLKGHKKQPTKAYRDLGYIRHKDYILHLLNVKENEKVLDVGCADGAMMVYCGLLGAEVYGIDISSESIEKANSYLNKYGLKGRAVLGDAKKLGDKFSENYFDKAVSSDFFEHLSYDDKIRVFKEIKKVLKPNGTLIIKTPNLTYLRFSKLFKQIARIMKLKNPFDVVIPHTTGGNPEHIGLITRIKMIKAIESAGFMNFKFYHDINSKFQKCYIFGEMFAEAPFLREIFTEDLIIVISKPIISSFFLENR